MKQQIFIGGAWPYANNSIHVGHLAALLPGDILAKYFRKCGALVIYVSGSDCHGTPITIRSGKLGISPQAVAEHYYKEVVDTFDKLNFSYDLYTSTMNPFHKQKVQQFIKLIDKHGLIYEKEEGEDYCLSCGKFLSDREIVGICPECGSQTNAEQCDNCLTNLSPNVVLNKTCKNCLAPTIQKNNKHLYFKLSALSDQIQAYVNKNKANWRLTTINESQKYLKEGLRDRAITRQLSWGIDIPFEGFEDKKMYVWIDAVLGYMTTGEKFATENGIDFEKFITDPNTKSYYSMGKDNIVFHTIILPGLLEAMDPKINKPDYIVACEYLNMNNSKISKSTGNMIKVSTLLSNFCSDSIRYYFTFNNPEKKDSTFSIDDFIDIHNKHLVGGYGNFVNRNLSFLFKKYGGVLPVHSESDEIKNVVKKAYEKIGKLIEKAELRAATDEMYSLIKFANKYYDESAPWTLYAENKPAFDKVTSSCLYLIANIANITSIIMPDAAKKVSEFLNFDLTAWQEVNYDENITLSNISVLFNRIDPANVDLTLNSEDTLK